MIDFRAFSQEIKSSDCDVLLDSPMSAQTTFKAGGNAKAIAFPKTRDALIKVLKCAEKLGIPYIAAGNGSNLLVRDTGFDGVFIKMTQFVADIEIDGEYIRCSSGTPLSRLCTTAYENSLTGLEFAYGIPGTVGGAVYMNAGAYGGEMKDVLISAEHVSPDLKAETLSADGLSLGYRRSFYSEHSGYIITDAVFKLRKGEKESIKAMMDDFIARRKDKQPLEYPSAGSTFKRPEGHFAGALIEQCGLKSCRIGGAEVSEKHAGFIINRYGGTADDIIALIEYVKKTVKEKTGVTLEPEVKIIP